MKKIYTAREIMDESKWHSLCELKGWNPWCVNEGLMDSSEEIGLNEKECEELGL